MEQSETLNLNLDNRYQIS